MFKDIHTLSRGNFEGALLIGSFPETQIIHRYIWRSKEARTQISGVQTNHRGWLRIVPEVRAANSDIILSDLDGNWEDLYFQIKNGDTILKVFHQECMAMTGIKMTNTLLFPQQRQE